MAKIPTHPESLLRQTDWLRALARELVVDSNEADDLAQEALMAGLRRGGSPRAPRAWLARIVRNLAAGSVRGSLRRRRRERHAAQAEAQDSAADTVARFDMHRTVCDAVTALDEPFRTAVLMRFWEDLPPREIGRRLGVPVETVRSRIRRGLERLRAALDERHGDRRTWVVGLCALPAARGTSSATVISAMGVGWMSVQKKSVWAVAAVILFFVATGVWSWSTIWDGSLDTTPDRVALGKPASSAAQPAPDSVARVPIATEVGGELLTITGTVVDEETGRPIEGAQVTVRNGGPTVWTAADGTFEMEAAHALAARMYPIGADSMEVLISSPDHATWSDRLFLKQMKQTNRDFGTIELPHGSRYSGTVETADGDPVEDASLRYGHWITRSIEGHSALPWSRELARTDSRGRFVLAERLALPPWGHGNPYLVAISELGLGWVELPLTRQRTDAEVTIRSCPNASLAVRVEDDQGDPVAGARVRVGPRFTPLVGFHGERDPTVRSLLTATTNASGAALLTRIPTMPSPMPRHEQFDVLVDAKRFPPQRPTRVEIRAGGDNRATVRVERTTQIDLAGCVKSISSDPLQGVLVVVSGTGGTVERTTDADGSFEFARLDVAPTGATLTFSLAGYESAKRGISQQDRTVDLTLKYLRTLRGRLTDQHGAAVADQVVQIGRKWACTAVDGTFEIKVTEGTHAVRLVERADTAVIFGRAVSPSKVSTDLGEVELVVHRTAGRASLVVALVDAVSGAPIGPTDVWLTLPRWGVAKSLPAESKVGLITAKNLTAQKWILGVRAPHGGSRVVELHVQPNETQKRLRVEVAEPGTVDGRIDFSALARIPETVLISVRRIDEPRWSILNKFHAAGRWQLGLGRELSDQTHHAMFALRVTPAIDTRFRLQSAAAGRLEFTVTGGGFEARQVVTVPSKGTVNAVVQVKPRAKGR